MSKPILTADVGWGATGWGVVQGGKVIARGCYVRSKSPTKKSGVRVAENDIQDGQRYFRYFVDVIERHGVKAVVAEMPHGGARGARPARCMAMATIAFATATEPSKLPFVWVTPHEVKCLTGEGAASKDNVAEVVYARWPELRDQKLTDHETDALAAYLVAENSSLVRAMNSE
jgi:Holliday junction resolvasome RuvABC endonuclease subunit